MRTTLIHNEICFTTSRYVFERTLEPSASLHRNIASNEHRLPQTNGRNVSDQFSRSLDRVQVRLNRFRKADRRLFFSFNQLLLSMLAPRLMRYQFDLMMHSVAAELFRKILVPAIGTISGASSNTESSSLLGSFGNLLRLRQTGQRTTTAAPNLDVQRLIDNAQKLISLQSMLRNNENSNINSNKARNNIVNTKEIKVNNRANNNNINLVTEINADRENSSSQSTKSNSKSDHPIQLAINAKDFLSFIQNNLKLNPMSTNYNATDTSSSTTSNANPVGLNNNPQMQNPPSTFMHSFQTNPVSNNEIKSNSDTGFFRQRKKQKKSNASSQKAKLEDFKMSHLTYIDTEVPNYGNQLLIRDHEDSSHNDMGKNYEHRDNISLLPVTVDKDPAHLKNNDDLERANRWNDVLVNMKRFG